MESLNVAPHPLIQDLKITLQCSYKIFPSEETERRLMFLSNLDQRLNFNFEMALFFPAKPDFPPGKVSKILEISLAKLLVSYDFLAGRLRLDPKKDRLEIDCNSSGIRFAVACSEVSLAEIGNLECHNPVFEQLILRNFKCMEQDDQPLFTFQVTSFKCGGFAIGLSINHVAFDGIGTKIFLENLASLAADKPLAITPCNDRKLLAGRSPPRVTFSHPEFSRVDQIQQQLEAESPEQIKHKNFRLSANDIMGLKQKAKLGNNSKNDTYITTFNVVTAHVWRCRALAEANNGNKVEKASTILYTTELRKRLNPALPSSFTGNAILPAYSCATYGDLERASFSELVEMVSVGARRMSDEYVRSAIDSIEMSRCPTRNCDIGVSSWKTVGFNDVEYPWGRPKFCCPVSLGKNLILFLPGIDDKGGVNILLDLPSEKMDKFQNLFFKFRSLL